MEHMGMSTILAALFGFLAAMSTFGVGWLRERRKGKGDAYSRATDWMDRQDNRIAEQDKKINELNRLLGELVGRLDEVSSVNRTLQAEKAALILENTELKAKVHTLENRRVRSSDPH